MGRVETVEGPYFSIDGGTGNYYSETTTYDKMGRVIRVEIPDGEQTSITIVYDYPNPFTKEITDPDGKKKTEKRDHLGRIIEVIEHAGDDVASPVLQTTGYEYNAAGDMTGVINALNIATDIVYDLRGLKTSMDDPDMGEWFYTYYNNGNLDTQLDAKGILIDFDYDDLNRIEFKTYTIPVTDPPTAATPDVKYTYDGEGIQDCTNCIGQLTSVTNADVTSVYDEYDEMGRALSVSKTIDGDEERRIDTTYDKSGKVETITYPDGFMVENYYYPGTGLLDEVTGTMSSDTVSYAKCTGYEPTGKIKRIYHAYNDTDTVYYYHSLTNRLMDIQTSGGADVTFSGPVFIQDRTYTYTKAGDISIRTDYQKETEYTYAYDNLHRLLSESSTGNAPFINPERLIFTYNDDENPNAVRNINYNGDDYGFTYDANGNMESGYDFSDPNNIVLRSIDWNADNMPVTITRDGVQTFLTYDGDGVRAKKVAGGTTTYYISNDYEIKNGAATKYIFAGNLRVATLDDTDTYIFHKDHLGSSTAMTKNLGGSFQIKEEIEYLPFGGMRDHTGTEVTDYKFTDQERDTSTNLYNYDARLYDPVIGRFVSADSIVPDWYDPQSLNRYSYTRNNPLKYTDPDGHVYDIIDVGFFLQSAYTFARNPSWANAGWLAADTVSLLPAVPSLGYGRVATKVAGTVADVASNVNKAENSANSLKTLGNASKRLQANKAQGAAFEKTVKGHLGQTDVNVVEQITVKTQSGTKTRLDFVSQEAGVTKLTEAKSSATAPLTKNQGKAFPEIECAGCKVVGKGKAPYTGGTEIPPTKVEVIRPEDLYRR